MMKASLLLLTMLVQPVPAPNEPAKESTVDFTVTITGLDGKPIPMDVKDATPLTLSDVAVTSLEAQTDDDRKDNGEAKFKRDELARKIYRNKAAELTLEEVTQIKERIGKIYGPLIVGAAWRILAADTGTEPIAKK